MMEVNEGHLSGRDRILINCGGVHHETFRSTLRNFPDSRLAWCTENTANNPDYNEIKGEFFFDRHPGVFAQIINYYRTGKLHTPHDVCGPLFQEELAYWGIDEKQMESCCWSYYTQHREAQENLKFFDNPNLVGYDNGSNQGDLQSEADIEEIMPISCWHRYKHQIWSVLENHRSSKTAKLVFALSLSFIIISVVAYCLQTWKAVKDTPTATLAMVIIEGVCGVWFTIEFALRCATCPSKTDFLKQFMNWIDVIAILPFYVRIIETKDYPYGKTATVYDVLATFRLFRLLRFFKVDLGFQILKQTMIASSRELVLLVMLLIIPVIIFANFAYISEKNSENTDFESIPDSLWWAIITITTVGYGDIAPTTLAGKVFGSLCAATSIIITALPISIIGNNFTLYYSHAQAQMKLPKKTRHNLVGAANALIADSAKPSEDLSDDLQPVTTNCTTSIQNGSNGDVNNFPYSGRARRARSSLYAGGIIQRQSLPIRTRSSEDFVSRSSPEDRKKSHTSTQSTIIDSPPKTPPIYGNTLTVGLPEMIDTMIDFENHPNSPKNQDTLTTHLESDEFDLDDVENAISFVKEHNEKKSNGLQRPGTPVKRAPKHAVRFVKPTLMVTTDDIASANCNDTFEDSENEEERSEINNEAKGDAGKTKKRTWSPARSVGIAPVRRDKTET